METVLIIEDDPVMLRGLKDNFEFEGYNVKTAADGDIGLKEALRVQPDLIILDLMLPKVNGYEICRFLREEKLEMPIIVLTAKGLESDKVLGLKLGADDYVTKPFSIKELLARAGACLRRTRQHAEDVHEFGECRLDATARTLTRGGEEVPLSPKEFELLAYFVNNAGRALSRDTIMTNVWGYDCMVTPRSIDRFVNALRNKIETDPANPHHIKTVREFGYKFEV
ncbi:MAG TPA: response regulator transcription factor [Chthoniobacteraceae bacterium]|jgi:DNA-binding response OmpR family regulator|nr:response regulator transcription factor [Chthoniobacteraceae bacterium]